MHLSLDFSLRNKTPQGTAIKSGEPNNLFPNSGTGLTGFIPFGFISFGSNLSNLNTDTIQGQRNAYVYCPVVTAIINTKANYFVNGRFFFEDSKGNEFTSQWQKLIDKPNPLTKSSKQFMQMAYVFAQVFGKCYIYKRTFAGMSLPSSRYQLWIIPNWEITVNQKITETPFESNILNYTWNHNGVTTTLSTEEIFTINDTGFDLTNVNYNYSDGASRLIGLKEPIKNIVSALQARGKILREGGPPFFISPEKSQMGENTILPDERKRIEDIYKKDYGYGEGQRMIRVTENAVKAVKMGINPNDMAAFEEVKEDIKMICNSYTFAHEIFGIEGTTFANKSEAKKWTYQNATIPDASTFCETLSTEVGMDTLNADYSNVEEMQANEKDKVDVAASLASGLKTMVDAQAYTPQEARIIFENNVNINTEIKDAK